VDHKLASASDIDRGVLGGAVGTKPLDPTWRICPYCEAEIPGVTPAPRSRRRRRRSSTDEIELEPEATASFEAPPQ